MKPTAFTAFTTFIIWMLTEQRYTITSNARLLEQAIEVPLLACVVVCMIDQSQKQYWLRRDVYVNVTYILLSMPYAFIISRVC